MKMLVKIEKLKFLFGTTDAEKFHEVLKKHGVEDFEVKGFKIEIPVNTVKDVPELLKDLELTSIIAPEFTMTPENNILTINLVKKEFALNPLTYSFVGSMGVPSASCKMIIHCREVARPFKNLP